MVRNQNISSTAPNPPDPNSLPQPLGASGPSVNSPGDWTIPQAQQHVDQWIKAIGVRYFSPLTNLAQLAEEVGEVARIINRSYGEQSTKPGETLKPLADELADVLFVTICLANQCQVDLQAALIANLEKKTRRDATRHLNNPKLHS